jgi:hypothetical protein
MTDMGIFRTTIAIENPSRRGTFCEIPDVMVDTGSEYTWVPRPDLPAQRLPIMKGGHEGYNRQSFLYDRFRALAPVPGALRASHGNRTA